ncbi:SPRY domain-containing protein [Coniochaeta sp. 2T2.1]|nr:SPRY domain-containing protein [Coniochaeta sp. 2T2.1]
MAPQTRSSHSNPDNAMNGVIIGLLSSFGSAILLAIIFLGIYFFRYTQSGRIFLDRIGRPGEYDDEQAFAREEAEALESMDEMSRTEYLRAKAFIQANPPESLQTDISLSQYLAIQEKGVSAWEFEPELEIANCFVEGRTEIEFFDSECSVLSNLPVPKQNEVYYWEAKIYDKPENTLISIGMATKPYPLFRLPGFHKYSAAYLSSGVRRFNQPFTATPYGPAYVQGDVIGVGYRPRTGTIFFTRNGKKLEDVVHGLKNQNFFPAVGATGPCMVHVNFGKAGFVFIEANVKKWGLAPVSGSLAPPPPYGVEQGTTLLESGRAKVEDTNGAGASGAAGGRGHGHSQSVQHVYTRAQQGLQPMHGRSRSGNFRVLQPTSPGPVRSPTDISLAQLIPSDEGGESSAAAGTGSPGPVIQPHPHPSQNVGLGLQQQGGAESRHQPPPPEYTSPENSDDSGSDESDGRGSGGEEEDNRPFIHHTNRSRGATVPGGRRRGERSPPIPSYSDAVRMGADAGRIRSGSAAHVPSTQAQGGSNRERSDSGRSGRRRS